jgi:hypothetical protein
VNRRGQPGYGTKIARPERASVPTIVKSPPVPLDFERPHAAASAQPTSKMSNARPARQPARGAANIHHRRVTDAGAVTVSIVTALPGLLRRRPPAGVPLSS